MKNQHIIGPRFTLNVKEQAVISKDEVRSQAIKDQEPHRVSVEAVETILMSTVSPQVVTGPVLNSPLFRAPLIADLAGFEDDDEPVLQTVTIGAVKKKRVRKKIRTFFINCLILFISLLFLAVLVVIVYFMPNLLYKVATLIVFLVACSYVASLQAKRIAYARQQTFLTVTQLVRAVRKVPVDSKDDDMKHLKLLKQDTMTYLRALTTRDLKKGSL